MRAPDRLSVWVPGGFPSLITLCVHVSLLVPMNVRGNDYGTGESETAAHRLGAVEQAAPLWVWGLLFTAVAALGFTSMACRWAEGVVASHTAATALYSAIGVGLLIDAIERSPQTGGQLAPILLVPAAAAAVCIWQAFRHRDRDGWVIAAAASVAVLMGFISVELDGLRNATILFGFAAVNGLLAMGTAQVATQDSIKRDRNGGKE